MDIAFVVYDDLTVLDFVGVYDPVTRLSTMGYRDDLSWDVCAPEGAEIVTGTGGLSMNATVTGEPLDGYDAAIVPGTVVTDRLRSDETFIEWLQTATDCEYKISVCTGAVLLGAAGLLEGHQATTHPSAYDDLTEYATVMKKRIVNDYGVITARGVTAAIDLGLYLCGLWADAETRDEIKEQMDYPYSRAMLTGRETTDTDAAKD